MEVGVALPLDLVG